MRWRLPGAMRCGTSLPVVSEDFPIRPVAPLPVGISECLLGSEVRYDGSGAKSSFPHAALTGLFEYRGICPEVAIGMSVPREPIRLVGKAAQPRAVGVIQPDQDVTEALDQYGREAAAGLHKLCGYVFMKGSPSCGLFRVKVYPHDQGTVTGAPDLRGRGIYAAAVTGELANLPVEENGRLNDPVLRENFVLRTFSYGHWLALVDLGLSAKRLIEFHSRYKYLLMAHSVPHYNEAGRLLSDLKRDLPEKAEQYVATLMKGLSKPATRKGHANVLSHLQGYLKRSLDADSRQELDRLISAYRIGEQPLLAPLTLLKHHFRRHPDEYVAYQTYLDPHPERSALRRSL
jgi:uncharacterized protein YbgA (DUF1722 family)/uncharacterized protein YbbK (DUF523 family)